jgi:trans-aconitate methyltransferase
MSIDPGDPGFSSEWLSLRESADAAARATDLLDALPVPAGPTVIRDLGCGTGSMGRWLAPRLPGPQHWILHDRDPHLLEYAARSIPEKAADGCAVTVETQRADITALTAEDLEGTALVTASALLDLLTADEMHRLAAACVAAHTPALLTLSVSGHVELHPAEPLDAAMGAAFDAHQRREVDGRRLLGPDAVDAAVEAFTDLGAKVQVTASPWRLGAEHAALSAEWLRGWVAAAVAQEPGLADAAPAYLDRRIAAADAGDLTVVVHHRDLLAQPG